MLTFFKRIGLFFVLNFVIVFTVSFILKLLNVQPYLTRYGLDIQSLALFCLIWGMSGALISLFLSKTMAKWMLGVKIYQPDQFGFDSKMHFIYQVVSNQANRLGLAIPEVGIFESSVVNAFATGWSKSHSLVAVSRGLLNTLSKEEVEAVIGHEMTHIANGDMVTMTLLQGVVNAFVMFLARVLAFALTTASRSKNSEKGSNGSFYLFTFLFEIIFMLIGSMIIAAYSRYREYRADHGGAELASKNKMIHALETLGRAQDLGLPKGSNEALNAFMIREGSKKGWMLTLFSTHPSIEKRIARLKEAHDLL